tara:strand:+ start:210 stop:578 length:369 start_codon:yes stop_codon:yes gene_type:complete
MKITKSQLKQIIQEELEDMQKSEEGEDESLDLPNLLMNLQDLLNEWEQKEYPSDEARYKGYYEDIENLVEKYDPCVHHGQSCEEAHQGYSHEECILQGKEIKKEKEPQPSVTRFMVSDHIRQ